ncbi:MAG: hypothetical protein IJE89_06480 [Bacilli bacterium]|nr:hypothetical protein [Bacilli bacterium]MBQ2981832.1 hypothetical protein [Lachnospiraceae bacterium]
MEKLFNCFQYALSEIDSRLSQINIINKTLEEKKGNNSRIKRICLSMIYTAGMLFNLYLVVTMKSVFWVSVIAEVSMVLFFLVLLIRNLLEDRYYRTIYNSECKLKQISRDLVKNKEKCATYRESLVISDESEKQINLGVDVDIIFKHIQEKIVTLTKRNTKTVREILICIYFVAAMSVGAIIMFEIYNKIDSSIIKFVCEFSVPESWAQTGFDIVYKICAICGIFIGPFFSFYYFEVIRLVELTDSLFFLIIGSSFCFFCISLVIIALVSLTIALVYGIVSLIIGVVSAILVFIFIVGIVVALVSGG